MSGKHRKGGENEVETDFLAAQKGIEFDAQWQESFDRAEEKREAGAYPYDQDKKV